MRRYGLGFFQGEDKTGTCLYRARSAFGLADITKNGKSHTALWIPRGLAIPLWRPGAQQTNDVHRIRIRRPRADLKEGDPKYMLLTGSGQAPMVLPPEGVSPGMAPWVVVEAELDAMAVHFACRMKVGVIAVLTNRGKPDDVAHKWLSRSPVILGALDFDPPGKKGERPGYQGWVWWEQTYAKARRWPVPSGKDPGEAFQKGVDLAAWINAGLPASLAFLDGNGKPGRSVVSDAPLGKGGMPPPANIVQKTPAEDRCEAPDTKPMPMHSQLDKPVQKTPSVRRWDGATKDTPLSEARFPHGFRYSLDYLINYYAGKSVDDALLVLCPRTTPAWYWLSFNRYCGKCSGHSHCLVDFLTSPQMLAPQPETEEMHHAATA